MLTLSVSATLLLRNYEDSDVTKFYHAVNEERIHLRPWIPWVDRIQTKIDALDFIEQGLQQIREQRALPLAIFENEKLIGGIGMHGWNHELQKAKIGYWLKKDYEGKGYMTLCCKAFLNYLFDTVKLQKVELDYFPDNKRSALLAERLGFKIEGMIRHSMKFHGSYRDLVICGMLQQEWNENITVRNV